jgi:hypothetical protein
MRLAAPIVFFLLISSYSNAQVFSIGNGFANGVISPRAPAYLKILTAREFTAIMKIIQ